MMDIDYYTYWIDRDTVQNKIFMYLCSILLHDYVVDILNNIYICIVYTYYIR